MYELKILNLTLMPRLVGNPFQTLVWSKAALDAFILENNNRKVCYISTYSYPDMFTFYEGKDDKKVRIYEPNAVRVDKIFQDLDCKDFRSDGHKLLSEVREFVSWCENNNLPYIINFSGKRGFHPFFGLRDKVYFVNTPELKKELKNKLLAVQYYLKKVAGLKSVDRRLMGDYKRLMRIPYTKYAVFDNGEYRVENTYCCPLPYKLLMKGSIDNIINYSKSPLQFDKIKYCKDNYSPDFLTLDEFIERFNISVVEVLKEVEDEVIVPYMVDETNGSNIVKLLAKLIPQKCLINDLLSGNPKHFTRFSIVCYLKWLGFNKQQIFEILKRVGWQDFRDNQTIYQINQIYRRSYDIPSCTKLGNEGICVGKVCTLYKNEKGGVI